jgi:ribosomal protein L37AE/L43A
MGALLMLHTKTHVMIDGAMHTVARVDEHETGPHHTHRVHTGCGLTIDVDVGGVRARARSLERHSHVMAEPDPAVRAAHAPHHLKAAAEAASKAEPLDGGRWHVGANARDCAACIAHERGADPVVHPLGHMPATTVEADIATNLACPKCGSKIYKRRKDGQFACTGQGHEFSGPELMTHVKDSFESLTALVTESK